MVYCGGQDQRVGQIIEFNQENWRRTLPFARDVDEMIFFTQALRDYGWIEPGTQTNPCKAKVTPAGWAKFHELTGSRSNVRNPVFVAMWFGGKSDNEKRDAMKPLFTECI